MAAFIFISQKSHILLALGLEPSLEGSWCSIFLPSPTFPVSWFHNRLSEKQIKEMLLLGESRLIRPVRKMLPRNRTFKCSGFSKINKSYHFSLLKRKCVRSLNALNSSQKPQIAVKEPNKAIFRKKILCVYEIKRALQIHKTWPVYIHYWWQNEWPV